MARRIRRTCDRLGMSAPEGDLVLDAFRLAMEPRLARISEDHHPDYLHPARTALILMDDVHVADPIVLAAALLTETRDPALAAPQEAVRSLDGGVADLVSQVPRPEAEGDRLLESLVTLPPGAARVAVAERLDHARHLHLRERGEWNEYHHVTRTAYAPVAARVEPGLEARLRWWCDMFARRFLDG